MRRAEPGLHQLELVGQAGAVVTLVAAEPDSSLVLRTQAGPLSRQPGEPVTLTAAVADGTRAVLVDEVKRFGKSFAWIYANNRGMSGR